MQARNTLVTALTSLINERESKKALGVIQLMAETSPADLLHVDDNNKTFLFLAMEKGLNKVSEDLFERFKNHKNIITTKTSENVTLLHLLARGDNLALLNDLLDFLDYDDKKLDFLNAKDNEGNRPLHKAAFYRSQFAMEQLLAHIKTYPTASKIVNSANKAGDTALHIILNQYELNQNLIDETMSCISFLMAEGMRLSTMNIKKQSSLSLLSVLPQKNSKDVAGLIIHSFNSLAMDDKHKVLSYYKNEYVNHPTSEFLRYLYRTCAGLISLKTAVIAHLESTEEIRNTYERIEGVPIETTMIEGKVIKIYPPIQRREVNLTETFPSHLAGFLPEYLDKLKQASTDRDEILELENTMRDGEKINLFAEKETKKELINHLDELINDLTLRLEQLNKLSPQSPKRKALGAFICPLTCLLYAALETWIAYEASIPHACYDREKYYECTDSVRDDYLLASFLFGIFGTPIIVCSWFPAFFICAGERTVVPEIALIDKIKAEILPLQEDKETATNLNSILKKIETQLSDLNKIQALKDYRNNMSALKAHLEELRGEVHTLDIDDIGRQIESASEEVSSSNRDLEKGLVTGTENDAEEEEALQPRRKGKERLWSFFSGYSNESDDEEATDDKQPLLGGRKI